MTWDEGFKVFGMKKGSNLWDDVLRKVLNFVQTLGMKGSRSKTHVITLLVFVKPKCVIRHRPAVRASCLLALRDLLQSKSDR